MNRKLVGFIVALAVVAGAAAGWAQNPTNLTVIRKSNNTIWKRTCNGTSGCSDWTMIGGKFGVQPTLTWDPSIQKYILVGIGNDRTSIWRTTFGGDGTWDGAWVNITGTSGGSPSPVAIAGGQVQPQTITVACPEQSLQTAVDAAQTGATINVTGTCEENVVIREEKARLTIDGGNVATLSGDSSDITVYIAGRQITIQKFSITGGKAGISVDLGGTAFINHNDINNTADQRFGGVIVSKGSSATIAQNNIHDNPGCGILLSENATARIGFYSVGDSSASPNTIQNNGADGIVVTRNSSARIAGNTIANNTGSGISVNRVSQADIASNTINSNGRDGINVGQNSNIQLGADNPTTFLQQPNITTLDNERYGIGCWGGGSVMGHLGSENQIDGTSGQSNLDSSCPYNLVTP